MTEGTFPSTKVQVKRLRVSAVNSDQGEFLAMKTLSGCSALRCDKAVTKFTQFGTDKMW